MKERGPRTGPVLPFALLSQTSHLLAAISGSYTGQVLLHVLGSSLVSFPPRVRPWKVFMARVVFRQPPARYDLHRQGSLSRSIPKLGS